MSEFTPTTEQVRGAYAAYVPTYVGPRKQAFDRWLAQHDAEVAERALRRAARTPGALHVNTGGIYMDGRTWLNERADTAARVIGGAS